MDYLSTLHNVHGIIIADKHSFYDFGAVLAARTVSYPQQIKITERVPYSNTVYDFSYLYGNKTFEERSLTYELIISEPTIPKRIKLNYRVQEIVNWLYSGKGKKKLIDTYTPEYHFMAEITDVTVEYSVGTAHIVSTWSAYPYRIPNENTIGLSEVL
ncbi:hypothetical protein FACS1894132_05780 [Clostridia bacterium]|nr:hypothetical protein FACS1894132_05780 [Clostridia bacterium]